MNTPAPNQTLASFDLHDWIDENPFLQIAWAMGGLGPRLLRFSIDGSRRQQKFLFHGLPRFRNRDINRILLKFLLTTAAAYNT
jgi:hypothetical protein